MYKSYMVVHPNGNLQNIPEFRLKEFQEHPDYEVISKYSETIVIVDGLYYRRPRLGEIAFPTFFTSKEDYTHVPDDHLCWEDPASEERTCSHCQQPWLLDEQIYLKSGDFVCARCGAWT